MKKKSLVGWIEKTTSIIFLHTLEDVLWENCIIISDNLDRWEKPIKVRITIEEI